MRRMEIPTTNIAAPVSQRRIKVIIAQWRWRRRRKTWRKIGTIVFVLIINIDEIECGGWKIRNASCQSQKASQSTTRGT